MTQIRIGFIGDSITHGTGDETLLGWPMRIGQAEVARGHDVTVYNLSIRADTSALIEPRWEAECRARLKPGYTCATIFAVGINDSAHEKSETMEGQRVPLERSLRLIGSMLTKAKEFGPVLSIGPTPVVEDMMPLSRLPGVIYDFRNNDIAAYNAAYAALSTSLDVPYLNMYAPLSADPAWDDSLRASDGLHPTAAGYELMAAHIGEWDGWRGLFDD